jgi:streptomycin 6-kinase
MNASGPRPSDLDPRTLECPGVAVIIPELLVKACSQSPERLDWLAGLPSVVRALSRRWSLGLAPPFEHDEGSCAWVAPVTWAGLTSAVLKIGMPHMEADHEIAGLRFWNGNPTVRLLDADEDLGAMLLERCEPGTHLRELTELEQDEVLAGLLRRLWREPQAPHPFRPLSSLLDAWTSETAGQAHSWSDPGLVREGFALFRELAASTSEPVLLGTDVHAGNVLRAQREPWLLIDPKPFAGDRAYDATQHLLNCTGRLRSDPLGTIRRFSDLLGVDPERVRLWTFARAAADPRDWTHDQLMGVTRRLAP